MDKAGALLLEALRCAIHQEQLHLDEMPEQDTLRRLFRLASEQSIFPLVQQALFSCPQLKNDPLVRSFHPYARKLTLHQAGRTGDFLLLMEQLSSKGLHPAVLKGIVCRSLYPEPEQRPSTDEDILIPAAEYERYHEALIACGLPPVDPDRPADGEAEITYGDPARDLFIELHLSLFSRDDPACGACNDPLEGALDRLVPFQVYGQTLSTFAPTDHLLFLLCHAYKHVLYGGVGIRQICDLCLFAREYAGEIDWQQLRSACVRLQILTLATAFFLIGERYLSIPRPPAFADGEPDLNPLLEDCLSGGVYGVEDPDRQRSSRITLDAVAAGREGRAQRGVWNSIFPGKAYLQNNFPYARKYPVLLPLAWAHRLWNYASRRELNASRSLRIGRERVELLRKYQIIP